MTLARQRPASTLIPTASVRRSERLFLRARGLQPLFCTNSRCFYGNAAIRKCSKPQWRCVLIVLKFWANNR